jgi:hypothetical protein
MKVINLLARQLIRKAAGREVQATEQCFSERIEFWSLCLEARSQLSAEKLAKAELKNAKNNNRRNPEVAT